MRNAFRVARKMTALMQSLIGALRCMAVAVFLIVGCTVTAWAQAGFDRPGGDYARFVVPSGDPAVCAARCEREGRCRAWGFSYPGTGRRHAMCWLKAAGDAARRGHLLRVRREGRGPCWSESGPIEFSIDRTGGDYRPGVPSDPTGASCRRPARARTAAAPGPTCGRAIGGSAALLSEGASITRPRRKPCCMSGVVQV